MARGKRKLLFDVLGSVTSESIRRPGSTGRREAKPIPAPLRSREAPLVLSRGFAGALGLVTVVFLGLAYWFGLVHGEARSAGGDAPPALRGRSSAANEQERATFGSHYAVKAVLKDFSKDTFEDRIDEFRAYVRVLKDKGYENVDVYRQSRPDDPTAGSLTLWVGRSRSHAALEDLARELQSLSLRGSNPFEYAFPALFTGPADR